MNFCEYEVHVTNAIQKQLMAYRYNSSLSKLLKYVEKVMYCGIIRHCLSYLNSFLINICILKHIKITSGYFQNQTTILK